MGPRTRRPPLLDLRTPRSQQPRPHPIPSAPPRARVGTHQLGSRTHATSRPTRRMPDTRLHLHRQPTTRSRTPNPTHHASRKSTHTRLVTPVFLGRATSRTPSRPVLSLLATRHGVSACVMPTPPSGPYAVGVGQDGSNAIALGSGRSGPVRAKLRRSVKVARDAGRLSVTDELRAVLAERLADVVDRAAAAGDGPAMERAAGRLLEAIGRLPLDEPQDETPAGGVSGGSDGGRARVVELLDRAPAVGDASHA